MVIKETERFPLSFYTYSSMVFIWAKLFSGTEKYKIVHILYKYLVTQYNNYNFFKKSWIDCMHSIFECGFSNIWNEQHIACIVNVNWITNAVKQRLKDHLLQKWSVDIVNYPKGHMYKTFNQVFDIRSN